MEVNECGGGDGVVSNRIYTFFLTWRIKSLQVLFLKLNEAKMQNGISAMVSAIKKTIQSYKHKPEGNKKKLNIPIIGV